MRCLLVSSALLLAGPCSAQDGGEGWITHFATLSPAAGITILGKMHAEKGTSWLVIRDLEKNTERHRLRHGGPIRSMGFTRDGSRFVTTEGTFGHHVFDSSTGKELAHLSGHRGWVWTVAISADGRRVASGGRDGTVRLWDVDHASQLWNRRVERQVGHLVFAADGESLIVAHHGGALELWGLDGKPRATLCESAGITRGMVLSADGSILVTGHNDGRVRVWDLATRSCRSELRVPAGRMYALALSTDNRRVACSTSERRVLEYELATGKSLRAVDLPPGRRNILALAYSPRHGLLGADYDGQSVFFDREPGEGDPAKLPTEGAGQRKSR